jgi:DNA primase
MQINDLYISADVSDIVKELREQLALNGLDYFAKTVDSGDDLMVCCPYHKNGQERRPSAGIRKSDGMFHCLACGETHSLPEVIAYCFGHSDFTFGYKWLVKNFSTAVAQDRADIKLNLVRNEANDEVEKINDEVGEAELDSYRYTHPYMYKRGLIDSIIEFFDIGYDVKTNSITFPVRNSKGSCMFVAKRSVGRKRFDLPKNIEKPLYGLYEIGQRKFSAKECGKIYVCEGLFDCLRLWCNGKFAVAGFGCLFSDYQVQLLNALPTRHLVLALDNDDAGIKATKRLKKVITNKLVTRVILPPHRKDIGECTDNEIQNLVETLC